MKAIYFKMNLRTIVKDKISLITFILGNIISITSIFLTASWILDEIYFESCHENLDQIYQINTVFNPKLNPNVTQSTCYPLGGEVGQSFPEVNQAFRIGQKQARISIGEEEFNTYNFCFIDQSAFNVLSFDFIEGSAENGLSNMNGIIISEDIKNKYFGAESALGKTITLEYYTLKLEMQVQGVYTKPSNSQFNLDFYASYLAVDGYYGNTLDNWISLRCRTYILVNENVNISDLEEKMSIWFDEKDPSANKGVKIKSLKYKRLREGDGMSGGTKGLVINLLTLFSLMLLMIILNYFIFSYVRLKSRGRSLALLKLFGASKRQIRIGYYMESILYIFFFSVISLLVLYYFIDDFNSIFDKKISIFGSQYQIISFILIMLIIGISGIIPLYTQYFDNPIKMLYQNYNSDISVSIKNKLPLILQLTGALFLVVVSLFYFKQYQNLNNMDLGYNKKNIIEINCTLEAHRKLDILRERWNKLECVESITASSRPPWAITTAARNVDWDGREGDAVFNGSYTAVSLDYIKTIQGTIIEGSDINEEFLNRGETGFLINQKALKAMNLKHPIGNKISLLGVEGEIVGVFKDFFHQKFEYGIDPIILVFDNEWGFSTILIRLTDNDLSIKVKEVKKVFEEILPGELFEQKYLEESLDWFALKKRRLENNLVISFAISVTLICCIGIFALSLFFAMKKKKETAIRKVIGASKMSLFLNLFKEFVFMEIVAIVLAFPMAYLFLKDWQSNFAIKVPLTPGIFILAAFIIFIILLSVSLYAILKVVRLNPIVVLRND